MRKHIIVYSKQNSMKGVLKKYAEWAHTGQLNYCFYVPKGSESHMWLANKKLEVTTFKIVNRVFRYVYLINPILINGLKEKHCIRYVGADFSLLLLLVRHRNIFLELHSNHMLELKLRSGIEGKVAFYLEYFLQRLCFKLSKGIIVPSLAIKELVKPSTPTHILMNSCVAAPSIRFSSVTKKREILIMASSFSKWHGLEDFQSFAFRLYSELGMSIRVIGTAHNLPQTEYILSTGFVEDDVKLSTLIASALYALDSLGYDKLKLVRSSSIKMFKYLEYGTPVLSLVDPPIDNANLDRCYSSFSDFDAMFEFVKTNMLYDFEIDTDQIRVKTILRNEMNFFNSL